MVCMPSSTCSISLGAKCSTDDATFVRRVFPGDRCICSTTKWFYRVLPNWVLASLERDLL